MDATVHGHAETYNTQLDIATCTADGRGDLRLRRVTRARPPPHGRESRVSTLHDQEHFSGPEQTLTTSDIRPAGAQKHAAIWGIGIACSICILAASSASSRSSSWARAAAAGRV